MKFVLYILTHPLRNSGQPLCSTQGPAPAVRTVHRWRALTGELTKDTCFDGGGNRGPWRKPMQAQGEHADSQWKDPGLAESPGPSCCEGTVLTTDPPHIVLLPFWTVTKTASGALSPLSGLEWDQPWFLKERLSKNLKSSRILSRYVTLESTSLNKANVCNYSTIWPNQVLYICWTLWWR